MRSRIWAIVLCLFSLAAAHCSRGVAAEGYGTGPGALRIESIRAVADHRIEVHLVQGRASDLEASDEGKTPPFQLSENGKNQEPLEIKKAPAASAGFHTVILADTSRSLTRRQFADFKKAALAFVARLGDDDHVAILAFDRKVYRKLKFTANRDTLAKQIRSLKQTGRRTVLYDALAEAHRMLTGAPGGKAIMVYTDGRENASHVTVGDLTELFTAQAVPLLVAGGVNSPLLKRLIRLSRISGGDAFRAEDANDLAKVFRYLTRLRTQEYILTYRTAQPAGTSVDITVGVGKDAASGNLVRSYAIPASIWPGTEKQFAPQLYDAFRTHMPEILLSLIVLLLVAVIVMLFFRRQEITVKVENLQPPTFITPSEIHPVPDKRAETNKVKLPLDYHHGWLVEKEGPHTGRKYRINWHMVTLGFADDNSIVIDDNTVSPRHAKIERDPGGRKFIIYDLMSETGTLLNGKKLLRPKELNDFDEIGLGRTKLIFRKSASVGADS